MIELKKELLYADLMLISTPHLVKRYNSALKKVVGQETNLDSFHIDCSGYSPEIANELNDPDYLDQNGVNKKFILISIHQEKLPVIRSHFSSTVQFIKEFIRDNRPSLMALSARDSIYGELDNSVYKVVNMWDIINADQVSIKIETPKEIVKTAIKLDSAIKETQEWGVEEWISPGSLDGILEMSKKTGNIIHSNIIPQINTYKKKCFFTGHFGGVYVFKGYPAGKTTILSIENELDEKITQGIPDIIHIPISKKKKVHRFLLDNGFLEKLDKDELRARRSHFKEKNYLVVADHMATTTTSEESPIDENAIRKYIARNFEGLPEKFFKIESLLRTLTLENEVDDKDEELLFYLYRVSDSKEGADNFSLLNHLISHFTPFSYLRMFTFNRELFIKRMEEWPESQRRYIQDYLIKHREIVENLFMKAQ